MTEQGNLLELAGTDPLEVFGSWFRDAVERGLPFADAFSLATVSPEGKPSVRIVLYKGMTDDGRVRFVTNFESQKARDLAQNPRAAAVFFWPGLERQVRIEGRAERAPDVDSDRYFAGRDRESQLGAWASAQSRPLGTRAELERALERERERWEGRTVERPPHWGMLYLLPESVELWIAGPHRLHDRFLYERTGSAWRATRLYP